MIVLNPQYIKDSNGDKTLVVLPIHEFNDIIEQLEAIEDIHLYDEAKKNDDGRRILLSDYIKKQKAEKWLNIKLS
jgi:hypothetical protein